MSFNVEVGDSPERVRALCEAFGSFGTEACKRIEIRKNEEGTGYYPQLRAAPTFFERILRFFGWKPLSLRLNEVTIFVLAWLQENTERHVEVLEQNIHHLHVIKPLFNKAGKQGAFEDVLGGITDLYHERIAAGVSHEVAEHVQRAQEEVNAILERARAVWEEASHSNSEFIQRARAVQEEADNIIYEANAILERAKKDANCIIDDANAFLQVAEKEVNRTNHEADVILEGAQEQADYIIHNANVILEKAKQEANGVIGKARDEAVTVLRSAQSAKGQLVRRRGVVLQSPRTPRPSRVARPPDDTAMSVTSYESPRSLGSQDSDSKLDDKLEKSGILSEHKPLIAGLVEEIKTFMGDAQGTTLEIFGPKILRIRKGDECKDIEFPVKLHSCHQDPKMVVFVKTIGGSPSRLLSDMLYLHLLTVEYFRVRSETSSYHEPLIDYFSRTPSRGVVSLLKVGDRCLQGCYDGTLLEVLEENKLLDDDKKCVIDSILAGLIAIHSLELKDDNPGSNDPRCLTRYKGFHHAIHLTNVLVRKVGEEWQAALKFEEKQGNDLNEDLSIPKFRPPETIEKPGRNSKTPEMREYNKKNGQRTDIWMMGLMSVLILSGRNLASIENCFKASTIHRDRPPDQGLRNLEQKSIDQEIDKLKERFHQFERYWDLIKEMLRVNPFLRITAEGLRSWLQPDPLKTHVSQ